MLFLIVGIIWIAFLVWFMFKADGDLTLLYKARYGKSIDELSGKVAWITGASSGIGEALAYLLASNNVKLVLSGTNTERLDNVQQKCIESGCSPRNILVVPFNITDIAVHEEKFQIVLSHFGKLDILINNAGRSQRSQFQDIEIEVHRELFEINVFGPVNLAKVTLPHFLENKSGHYVITSSTAGIMGAPFSATYTATKHAINGYFDSMRSEFALNKSGIDVTVLLPGPISSGIVKNAFTGKLGEEFKGNDEARRMSADRCAYLMGVAIANKMDHAWISIQPILTLHYLAQYTPSFLRNTVIKIIPQSVAQKLRGGKCKVK